MTMLQCCMRLRDALQEDSRSDLEYSYFLSPFLRSIVVLFFGGPKLRGPMLLSAPVVNGAGLVSQAAGHNLSL